jgi:hypothetical protein
MIFFQKMMILRAENGIAYSESHRAGGMVGPLKKTLVIPS